MSGKPVDLTLRLARHMTVDENGCWLWTASLDKNGYGQMTLEGRCRRAHQVSYENFIGEIPVGLEPDHLCRNRRCINPRHLEYVTHLENVRRGSKAMKTHCTHGHEYTITNTGRNHGRRACRACARLKQRSRRTGVTFKTLLRREKKHEIRR